MRFCRMRFAIQFDVAYLTRILVTVCVAGAQERRQNFLIVSGPMEHLLAHAVLDYGHLCAFKWGLTWGGLSIGFNSVANSE